MTTWTSHSSIRSAKYTRSTLLRASDYFLTRPNGYAPDSADHLLPLVGSCGHSSPCPECDEIAETDEDGNFENVRPIVKKPHGRRDPDVRAAAVRRGQHR